MKSSIDLDENIIKFLKFKKFVDENIKDVESFLDQEKLKLNDGSVLCYCNISDYLDYYFMMDIGIKPDVKPLGEDCEGMNYTELNELGYKYQKIGYKITDSMNDKLENWYLRFDMEEDINESVFKPVFLVRLKDKFDQEIASKMIYALIKAKDEYLKEFSKIN